MSGFGGFAPIGNNIPRPIVNNVPVVDNTANNNSTHIVQGGDNPNVPANVMPRAADLVGQLDILLLNAAKNVATLTGKESVKSAATAAGLPKATVKNLASLAEAAQKSVAALDRFNGRQLADAMVKNEDGTVEWKPGNDVAKALKTAQEDQVKLSSALANALGKAKNATTQAALEELMLQCDRRVAEIETLCLQMAEIVEKGGDKVQDEADALAGGKLSAFTSKDALDKFDRGSALAAMKAQIKPLADRLAGYAQGGGKSLTEADVASCTQELNALKAKLSEAGASGKLEVGGKTIFCDRSMLAEASKMLGQVGDKIASMHRDIIKGAMRNLVENSFPFLKDEIFEDRFVQELGRLRTPDGDTAGELSHFVNLMNVLRNNARAFIESPTPENKAKLLNAANVLQTMNRSGACGCLYEEFLTTAMPGKKASAEFKAALANFKAKVADEDGAKFISDLRITVNRSFSGITVAADKLVELAQKLDAGPGNKVYVSGWVLGAFRGEETISSIVEAWAHGYDDCDIDPQIDDSNVLEARELGSGAFNTVTLLKLNDGSEWVFKPEMPARLTTSYSTHFEGMSKNMEFTRVNLAVNDTANTLGLNDVMVTTKAGTHKGRFGMFMEKAPGLEVADYRKADSGKVGEGKLSISDLRNLEDEKFGKVMGRMMRQTNRLMWFDILTAQSDRHGHNYFLEIDKNTLEVSVKGIDNDASYGVLRTGLKTFNFPAGSSALDVFLSYLADFASSSPDEQGYIDQIRNDPGIKVNNDKSIDIDLDKVQNRKSILAILNSCGIKSVAVPEEMDKELHDKLVALAPDAPDGGAARAAYLDSLATRLGADSQQYKCAVKRLDEAIAHARKLNSEGKVYSAEQWEKRDIQKSIAKKALAPAEDSIYLPKSTKTRLINNKSNYTGSTNFVIRDMYQELIQNGNHKDWFE